MSETNATVRKPAAAALAMLLACFGIAACGGSSNGSSTQTSKAAAATPTSGAAPSGGARFGALRACLQQNGITLPKGSPGQGPGAGGLPGGGSGAGPQLPKGVTQAQFDAALKKCGGANFARRGRTFNSPTAIQGLTKFAACMRSNGVNLPAPNTSGKGPVFSTKGLNTSSAQFRTAQAKCSSDLRGAFGGAGQGAGAPPAGGGPGGPPGSGGAPPGVGG